ncbi:MAG TPA: TonB-dependent receptor [Muribaculaceae bacterium]|nr:TonB-dependent receptor [Muribaculaceae bacterium]
MKEHRVCRRVCVAAVLAFAAATAVYAQPPEGASSVLAERDSAATIARSMAWSDSIQSLHELIVTTRRPWEPTEIIPVQTLAGEELRRLSSNSVADALRYFSGVQVKDYGGVGGIKTVNIRSMGTNHTGVVYDGVALGNAQNGQIDLGQFSLDNMEALSLYNGQKSQILQPARDFGNAGTIYMRTAVPQFKGDETYHARAAVRTGSFDLINPSALVQLKLSRRVSASLSAEWLNSSGKYKFRYRRVNPAGEVAYDTTATRQNGDINATRLEASVFGKTSHGNWMAKAYNYNSERGIPGAIVNNVWRRGERIWDTNSFIQGHWRATYGRWTTLANAKYAFYRTHYVNNDDKQIKVDNLYRQREVYVSTANQYDIIPGKWEVSASYDFMFNSLDADVYDFVRPERYSNLLSAATAITLGRFKGQASALATFVRDMLEEVQDPPTKHVFTPAVYASYAFVDCKTERGSDMLSLRAFYKRSFRMPTFNDLYYADMGNSKLNPERVTQYNVGIVYDHARRHSLLSSIKFSADGYYNKVHDKIVAYPKGQQFRWTMLNLGLVDIRGVDISAAATVTPRRDMDITLRLQYTWQRAIDITNPEDNYYRDQIPYIPHHSGSAIANIAWRRWNLNYSFIYVGERYNQQENIRYNYTQPWYTSDVSLTRDFTLGKVGLRATVEVNNLLSQDYDVIINYPMPKRNYRFTLTVTI